MVPRLRQAQLGRHGIKVVILRGVLTIIFFSLLAPAYIFPASVEDARHASGPEYLVVNGIGYPPIKAQSEAQARLLARRAAVIDAYRNALATKGAKDHEEGDFYAGIQGFVKGMTIVEEEYLEDGGIRVVAKVPATDTHVTSGTTYEKTQETGGGPSRVSLDEWYRIVNKSVKIER
jgi:hypothetical protein